MPEQVQPGEEVAENVDLIGHGLTPDSSIDDILAAQEKEETSQEGKPSSEVTPDVKEGESVDTQQEQAGAEPEKPSGESQEPDWVKERISKIAEQRRQAEERALKYEALLRDPEVMRTALRKQGYTEESINAQLQAQGLLKAEPENKSNVQFNPETASAEDWIKYVENSKQEAVNVAYQKFQEDQNRQKAIEWEKTQRQEAKDLASQYGVEFGELPVFQNGQVVSRGTVDNPNTAAGIMYQYLQAHPEDYGLGHVKVLRLAMAGKAYTSAKEEGVKSEKQRQETLKQVAMEGTPTISEDVVPDHNSSVEEIMAYKEKHPNWSPI